jgi:hypothetical protein
VPGGEYLAAPEDTLELSDGAAGTPSPRVLDAGISGRLPGMANNRTRSLLVTVLLIDAHMPRELPLSIARPVTLCVPHHDSDTDA